MSCIHKGESSAFTFAYSGMSETVQNYGCLPTPQEIVVMRIKHGKTWACHEDPSKPCQGALDHLRREGHQFKVIDPKLVTEKDPWHLFTE